VTEKQSDSEATGISKSPTGIEGFDHMTGGGLPRGRTTLVVGAPGSGKTVFALQTLVNGAQQWGEPGIFVAFEESSDQIRANAATFGWDLPSLERDRLFFLDARMPPDVFTTGEFDLKALLVGLDAKAKEMRARRIAFDSVDVLLSLLSDPASERREVYRLRNWLADSNLSGLVTFRADTTEPTASSRYGFVQYMADCVVLLSREAVEGVSQRDLRVLKYRGSSFAEGGAPFIITSSGMEVASLQADLADIPVSSERIPTGIPAVDEMLQGGYYRGTSVLITGAPGSAKSTLASSFIESACARGERSLYTSFDEASNVLVRNMSSVGINLKPHLESGLLRIASPQAGASSPEETLALLKNMIVEHQPTCLAIDPMSAMITPLGDRQGQDTARRLVRLAKSRGITLICTSLLEGDDPYLESSRLTISSVADTWMHLSYVASAGERNRALTIIKSRGTHHSSQVRELILSDDGVSLSDVYTAGGEVLMGTMRWEKESEDSLERERRRTQFETKRRELQWLESEAEARLQAVRRELEVRRAELEGLEREQEILQQRSSTHLADLRERRESGSATHKESEAPAKE
jgi:circadian clock protein KaiC